MTSKRQKYKQAQEKELDDLLDMKPPRTPLDPTRFVHKKSGRVVGYKLKDQVIGTGHAKEDDFDPIEVEALRNQGDE